MHPHPPKATSVTEDGQSDGWQVARGFWQEKDWGGTTRLVVSAPPDELRAVHKALLACLSAPVGFLYRQVVDRREPRPEGAPARDFVALELEPERLLAALDTASDLVWHDARAEYWARGAMGEQVVMDGDGLVYCYPDDPSFRDALAKVGLPEGKVEVLTNRDYVRHWFQAGCDAQEDALIASLGLTEVAPQKRT